MEKFIDVPLAGLQKITMSIINKTNVKSVLDEVNKLDTEISKRTTTDKMINGNMITMVKITVKEYNWFKNEYELPF